MVSPLIASPSWSTTSKWTSYIIYLPLPSVYLCLRYLMPPYRSVNLLNCGPQSLSQGSPNHYFKAIIIALLKSIYRVVFFQPPSGSFSLFTHCVQVCVIIAFRYICTSTQTVCSSSSYCLRSNRLSDHSCVVFNFFSWLIRSPPASSVSNLSG